MSKYLQYNVVLVGTIGFVAFVLLGSLFFIQPTNGELTRMGGYLESDFGWNEPQQFFEKALFRKAKTVDEYSEYFDIVVFGDSFSDNIQRGWQNYLVAETGWSVISFNMSQTGLEDILASSTYKEQPPRVFIYQSVERNLVRRNRICPESHKYGSSTIVTQTLPEPSPTSVAPVYQHRVRNPVIYESLDLSPAVNYWHKFLLRTVAGRNFTEVANLDLISDDKFSSRISDQLLVITRDFQLASVDSGDIDTAQCALSRLQARIQANDQTNFAVLIFPDKTSVYADYLVDRSLASIGILRHFEETPGLNIVKISDEMAAAVSNQNFDVYLPNDTHCGFLGYELAANVLVESIKRWGWTE